MRMRRQQDLRTLPLPVRGRQDTDQEVRDGLQAVHQPDPAGALVVKEGEHLSVLRLGQHRLHRLLCSRLVGR